MTPLQPQVARLPFLGWGGMHSSAVNNVRFWPQIILRRQILVGPARVKVNLIY